MPQEFQVLRCCHCETFQVHQVKKSNKWNCKMCGEKQTLQKVFGKGSGADCRKHVQHLNVLRGQAEAMKDSNLLDADSGVMGQQPENQAQKFAPGMEQGLPPTGSKWSDYLEDQEDGNILPGDDDDGYSESQYTTAPINSKRGRKYGQKRGTPYSRGQDSKSNWKNKRNGWELQNHKEGNCTGRQNSKYDQYFDEEKQYDTNQYSTDQGFAQHKQPDFERQDQFGVKFEQLCPASDSYSKQQQNLSYTGSKSAYASQNGLTASAPEILETESPIPCSFIQSEKKATALKTARSKQPLMMGGYNKAEPYKAGNTGAVVKAKQLTEGGSSKWNKFLTSEEGECENKSDWEKFDQSEPSLIFGSASSVNKPPQTLYGVREADTNISLTNIRKSLKSPSQIICTQIKSERKATKTVKQLPVFSVDADLDLDI